MTRRRSKLITVSMPPGVEHANRVASLPTAELLITVSMPPGVEHPSRFARSAVVRF